ncbi:hypothetical protein [Nitrosospira sp. Is2]|uniref:hypothetical protein n=1 Tax=Nitrosospira sp. Is2 TaxID=3080532 RepID=UPI00295539F1|nr:hypothetical protein [Nitrosospira sp. Is2]WON74213.1 hypothetical protein R5L00_01605 [Nitrosospira sp. Is2]
MIPIKENILRLIGGEYVAAETKQLPDPNTAKEEFQETVMEVPNLGKVRFTCRRFKSKHHKSVNIVWSAIAAVKVDQVP